MNLSKPLRATSRFLYFLVLKCRNYLPRQQCFAFGPPTETRKSVIEQIYVINLDRQPHRWRDVLRELSHILDASSKPLSQRVIRYSACDAQSEDPKLCNGGEVEPFYTLSDQLFVEPQPHALPDEFDLMNPIRMSRAEVAVAYSHIGIWKTIAKSDAPYALIVEDDVLFESRFGRTMDKAWIEIGSFDYFNPSFDILYLSYMEARFGAPKELISENLFRPERGIWFLSGYVLSKKGAQKLLNLLPCYGPIDLWINHKFRDLNVLALRRSIINQRRDTPSTNSYSILPALNRIGVLDGSDASLFHQSPTHTPVFAFGAQGSGLTSLAMALSMLGYRCCNDLNHIPNNEFEKLLAVSEHCIFNAYVNIASLSNYVGLLIQLYPNAKFIVTGKADQLNVEFMNTLKHTDLLCLNGESVNTWIALCEHLRLPPPTAPYPIVMDINQRTLQSNVLNRLTIFSEKSLKHDLSPWVVQDSYWQGINVNSISYLEKQSSRISFEDNFVDIQTSRWKLRNDTFPGNLGLFRSANISVDSRSGLSLIVNKQSLGVRNLGAAAISSINDYLYGRFEATLQATNVSGLVTGFFLHRDSPRQEIDVEITGNRPDRLLVNVYYNPGTVGSKFDYGYRGTPVSIELGFDASKALHKYAIEWNPYEISWFVDGVLVHRRSEWNPTPIPHLPMTLHVNTWPSRSRELAGRLSVRSLPASSFVGKIFVDAWIL